MELALFTLALVVLGAGAVRFGADSRPGITASGHDLAWTETDPIRPSARRPVIAPSRRSHIAGTGIPVRSPSGIAPDGSATVETYPLLDALDRVVGSGAAPLTRDRCAGRLERTARALTDQRWSEHVWLTGLIDQKRLDAVRAALDRQRATSS